MRGRLTVSEGHAPFRLAERVRSSASIAVSALAIANLACSAGPMRATAAPATRSRTSIPATARQLIVVSSPSYDPTGYLASFASFSRAFGPMSEDISDRGLSAGQIEKQIDASLRRLRIDYIDLYQAHRFDTEVPIDETVEAFEAIVCAGKARYLGFSERIPE